MPAPKKSRRTLRSLCAEVGAEDGLDPRIYFRKDGDRKPGKHRAWQLARQVAEAVDGLLAGCTTDPVLTELRVVSVAPAPDAATLLVTVTRHDSALALSPDLILSHLAQASGWLRAEVAAAITRKRAPLLVYQVVEVRPGPV